MMCCYAGHGLTVVMPATVRLLKNICPRSSLYHQRNCSDRLLMRIGQTFALLDNFVAEFPVTKVGVLLNLYDSP